VLVWIDFNVNTNKQNSAIFLRKGAKRSFYPWLNTVKWQNQMEGHRRNESSFRGHKGKLKKVIHERAIFSRAIHVKSSIVINMWREQGRLENDATQRRDTDSAKWQFVWIFEREKEKAALAQNCTWPWIRDRRLNGPNYNRVLFGYTLSHSRSTCIILE
jgi:hypothetical protein